MATKLQVTSPDLLVHPGETLEEIIIERGISQKELSVRTGVTEKHISTIINGKRNISAEFAMKLQYALDIKASFWKNLQSNYDLEVVLFNEVNNISNEEILVAKEIKNSVEEIENQTIPSKNWSDCVWYLRRLLGLSNLKSINDLNYGFYRSQFAQNTSENKMYVWQYLCEKEVESQTLKKLDKDKLKNSLSHIKAVMRQDSSTHIESIQKILNDCGILYTVKKHVKNAPIKGLTVKTKKDQVMIAMTIRDKYVDIFWFTLFHEIAHVIYDDYLINQDDLLLNPTIEKRADKFAADTLIDPIMF